MLRHVELSIIKIEERERKDFGDMESLVASIKEHGVLQPITLDSNMKLLAGERRYRAAMIAELHDIPALIRDVGTQLTDWEIELAENVHRKDFTWVERAKLEQKICNEGMSIRGAADIVGFSKTHLARDIQLAEALEYLPELANLPYLDAWKKLNKIREEMVVSELKKRAVDSSIEVGEEWVDDSPPKPGEVREKRTVDQYVYCADANYKVGDALEEMSKLIEVDTVKFDFAEVDPPYGIDLNAQRRVETAAAADHIQGYQEIEAGSYYDFLIEATSKVHKLLSPNSWCLWWFGPTNYTIVRDALTDANFTVSPIPAIWYKGDQGQTQQPDIHLANCYEMMFICRKGSPIIAKPGRSNVFHFPGVAGQSKIHHTERPLDMMVELLSTFAVPMHRVLVPFLGSGNTLRAAYINRNPAIGWDIDKSYKNNFILKVQEDFNSGKYPTD